MNQIFIQELINDLLKIDPELQNIKSELEKLIKELITNRPQTPFTKEFKDDLKAQIIWAINEQRIFHEEEKNWDRKKIIHSIKFWMIGISTITTGLLVFVFFQYINNNQKTDSNIIYNYDLNNLSENRQETKSIETTEQNTIDQELPTKQPETKTTAIINQDSNLDEISNNNIEITTISDDINTRENSAEYSMMAKTAPIEDMEAEINEFIEDTDLAITETTTTTPLTTSTTSPTTFCETSKQFLISNNISNTTTKQITYDNKTYKANIDFTKNSINFINIWIKNDSKIPTEEPSLNVFFENNNINIKADYLPPIIEEFDTYIEYYYPRNNNKDWITARIDKKSNTIISINNICIF